MAGTLGVLVCVRRLVSATFVRELRDTNAGLRLTHGYQYSKSGRGGRVLLGGEVLERGGFN